MPSGPAVLHRPPTLLGAPPSVLRGLATVFGARFPAPAPHALAGPPPDRCAPSIALCPPPPKSAELRTSTQVTCRANRKKRLTVLYIVEHPNQEGDTCIDGTSQYCWTNGWNCLWRGHSVYRNRPLIPQTRSPPGQQLFLGRTQTKAAAAAAAEGDGSVWHRRGRGGGGDDCQKGSNVTGQMEEGA